MSPRPDFLSTLLAPTLGPNAPTATATPSHGPTKRVNIAITIPVAILLGVLFSIALATCYCYFSPRTRRIRNRNLNSDDYADDSYPYGVAGHASDPEVAAKRPPSWRQTPSPHDDDRGSWIASAPTAQPTSWLTPSPPTKQSYRENPHTQKVSQAFGIEPPRPKTARPDTAVVRMSKVSKWTEKVADEALPPQADDGWKDPNYYSESRPETAVYEEVMGMYHPTARISTAPTQPTISEAEMTERFEREAMRPDTAPSPTSPNFGHYSL